jgi:cell division protein FtsB
MVSRLGVVWGFIAHYKYLVVTVLGILIIGFFDEDSFMRRIQLELQISDLKSDIDKYNKQYEDDSKQLREIRRNSKTIEKIARERYFMKADDEDIYVLSDDEKPLDTNDETTE